MPGMKSRPPYPPPTHILESGTEISFGLRVIFPMEGALIAYFFVFFSFSSTRTLNTIEYALTQGGGTLDLHRGQNLCKRFRNRTEKTVDEATVELLPLWREPSPSTSYKSMGSSQKGSRSRTLKPSGVDIP